MTSDKEHKDALSALKQAYERNVSPPGLQERVWSSVVERGRRTRRPWLRPALAFALAGCIAVAIFSVYRQVVVPEEGIAEKPPLFYRAEVVTLHGDADVTWGGKRRPAKNQMALQNGASIRTGPKSVAVVEVGPHRAKIANATGFEVNALARKKLEFTLFEGHVEMTAAPLEPGSILRVRSGSLSVTVVGTIFAVTRTAGCSEVAVSEGTVQTVFAGETGAVAAGEKRSFCESSPTDPPEAGTDEEIQAREKLEVEDTAADRQRPRRRKGPESSENANSKTRDLGLEPSSGGVKDLSREEELIKRAQLLIVDGDAAGSIQALEEYLEKYPGGLFYQEALFDLIRQNYRLKRIEQTYRYSSMFLQKFPGNGHRTVEVTIICAQSVLELNRDPGVAFKMLSGLVNRTRSISQKQREQVIYLYVLAAYRTGQGDLGDTWARRYLDLFPDGRYAKRLERIIESKGDTDT